MATLTARQIKILQAIIEKYILTASPISSNDLIEEYFKTLSPATIRNEMFALEKYKLLEKVHTSSGRIPTVDGFKFYESKILKPKIENNIRLKLQKIFKKRNLSIDNIIDQSVEIISDTLQLPSVVSLVKKNEKLKRFDVVQIDSKSAVIIIITSSGNIDKTIINFNGKCQINDISTCIRIFNDRLVDTDMSDLYDKIYSIKEIIRHSVTEYEFCIQQIVEKLFNEYTISNQSNSVVKGVKWLTKQPEFTNISKMTKVLDLLENTNVWKQISYNLLKTGKTSIIFGEELGVDNTAIASTVLNINNNSHHISLIGPTRMNYSKAKALLDFLKNEIENLSNPHE